MVTNKEGSSALDLGQLQCEHFLVDISVFCNRYDTWRKYHLDTWLYFRTIKRLKRWVLHSDADTSMLKRSDLCEVNAVGSCYIETLTYCLQERYFLIKVRLSRYRRAGSKGGEKI